MNSGPVHPDFLAARLAVLSLRALWDERTLAGHAGTYIVAPDTELLDADGAARALARRVKPILVRSRLDTGVLHISVEQLTPDHLLWFFYQEHLPERDPSGVRDLLARHYGLDVDDKLVFCEGAGDTVLLTLSDFEDWQRSYLLNQPHGYGVDYTDRHRGLAQWFGWTVLADVTATVTVSFGPGGSIAIRNQ